MAAPPSHRGAHTADDAGEGGGGVELAPGLRVPEGVLRFSFSRSGGPGGQNVNKVATKAELRVSINDLPLSARVRGRLCRLAGKRLVGAETITDDEGRPHLTGGELVLVSESERSQARNRAECLAKLRELLIEAKHVPKVRKPTRPTRGSKERRLTEKKLRGEIKKRRQDGSDK